VTSWKLEGKNLSNCTHKELVPFQGWFFVSQVYSPVSFTSNILLQYLRLNRIVIPSNDTSFDESYWYGTINQATCKATLLLFDCFRYCIWNFKNRKTVPTLSNLQNMMDGLLSGIFARRPHMLRDFLAIPHLNYLAHNLQVAG
jgi:hypothetical protein